MRKLIFETAIGKSDDKSWGGAWYNATWFGQNERIGIQFGFGMLINSEKNLQNAIEMDFYCCFCFSVRKNR